MKKLWSKAGAKFKKKKTKLKETEVQDGDSADDVYSGARHMARVLKKGAAMRVIFFYPGEEGTYVDNAGVTLYDNGIVHIKSNHEETSTHLQNCEILWNFEVDSEERTNKVRLLKPKAELRAENELGSEPEARPESLNQPKSKLQLTVPEKGPE